MSHFTLMVLGDNIEEQLRPFCEHEEYTSEFHVFKDMTDEVLTDWQKDTVSSWYPDERISTELRNIEKVNNGEDVFINTKDMPWFRKKAGSRCMLFYRHNKDMVNTYVIIDSLVHDGILVYFTPPPKEIPVSERYESMDEYAKEYHGYKKVGDAYGYYTNPNAKWDWYQVGGRWRGFFKCKENNNGETKVGAPGAFNNEAREGYVDSLLKKDIDFDSMFNDVREAAEEEFDAFMTEFYGIDIPSWSDVRAKHGDNIDDAREEFNSSEYHKKLSELMDKGKNRDKYVSSWLWADDIVKYFSNFDKEKFIMRRINSSFTTFAFLNNGVWSERGSMGWWGCVSDEQDDWETEFCRMFSMIPDNTRITIVDCHI